MPPLRAAVPEDEDAIVALLHVAHAEVPFGRWDEGSARATVRGCIANGVVILSLSHDRPVGTLGMCPSTFWWSDEPILQEKWVFVHPQHRRAPHARALLKLARETARGAGMPLLIGVMSSIRTTGKVKLFMGEFGAPIGASFLVGA